MPIFFAGLFRHHPQDDGGQFDRARAARGSHLEKNVNKLIVIMLALASSFASAHSGGTNKNGCHNDNKNGGYHCH